MYYTVHEVNDFCLCEFVQYKSHKNEQFYKTMMKPLTIAYVKATKTKKWDCTNSYDSAKQNIT